MFELSCFSWFFFFRFANILILLLFPELMIMMYDVWMSNIIARKRYQGWPEIKILINVRCVFFFNPVIQLKWAFLRFCFTLNWEENWTSLDLFFCWLTGCGDINHRRHGFGVSNDHRLSSDSSLFTAWYFLYRIISSESLAHCNFT